MPTQSIVSPILKTTFDRRAADLRESTTAVITTNTATARLVENQHSEAKVRGFTVVQDEPATVAGTGKGPTPTDFFVASIAFCENVIFARTAAMDDVQIQALETSVTGDWDQRGLFEIAGSTSAFKHVVVETRVTTTSPIEKVVTVARLTHRRCPIHQTLKSATDLSFKLFVNGVETPL